MGKILSGSALHLLEPKFLRRLLSGDSSAGFRLLHLHLDLSCWLCFVHWLLLLLRPVVIARCRSSATIEISNEFVFVSNLEVYFTRDLVVEIERKSQKVRENQILRQKVHRFRDRPGFQ